MDSTEAGYRVLGKLHALRASAVLDTSAQQNRDLLYAVRSGNYQLFEDAQKNLIGYVTWAAINRDGWRMLRRRQFPVYLSEWNEGRVMLPMDVVILPEWRPAIHALLRPVSRHLPLLAAWRPQRAPRLYFRQRGER